MRALWSVCGMALLLAPLSLAVTGPAADAGPTGVKYELVIACPLGNGFSVSDNPGGSCPVRAVDSDDQMGDPALAVDPFQPQNLILASLHGGTYSTRANANACPAAGPTPKARCGQVFTTFTSTDAGASWYDNPFSPPDAVGPNAYGMTPAITIDPYGHVFVGSLYAVPDGRGSAPHFTYVIAAQKFSSLRTINAQQTRSGGAYHVTYLGPTYGNNTIRQMWFLFNPATENMTLVWQERNGLGLDDLPCFADTTSVAVGNEYLVPDTNPAVYQESNGIPGLQTPSSCPAHPDQRLLLQADGAAVPAAPPPTPDAAALAHAIPAGITLPAEQDADGNGTEGNSTSTSHSNTTSGTKAPPAKPAPRSLVFGKQRSIIGVAWTGASVSTPYRRQKPADAIGPCSDSTNPVLSDGYLYIGCVANPDEGPFKWDPGAQKGRVELFRMDPSGGTPVWLGASPILGGSPKLGVRSDGRLALLSASASEDGRLVLEGAFGHYQNKTKLVAWGPLQHYGDKLERVDPAVRVIGARVQDVIYREYSGAVHFILKEDVQPTGIGVPSVQARLAPHIHKSLVALDETYGILVKHNLDVGNLLNRTGDSTLLQAEEAAYDDITDDFLQLPAGNMTWDGAELGPAYQREFFAVGDYGQVQFAEVVELTTLRGPAALPPPNPPVPVASPALSTTATQVLVPAAGLSVSTLMAVSFVLHRRKTPAAILARLKKK